MFTSSQRDQSYIHTMKETFKRMLIMVSFVLLSMPVQAQSSLADLHTEHRQAVEQQLKAKPHLRFVSERDYGAGTDITLSVVRGEMEQSAYHPYYAQGDFNGDHHLDFAVILNDISNVGGLSGNERDRTILVFNGNASDGYALAHSRIQRTNNQDLLHFTEGRLYYSVTWESDYCYYYVPFGRGYEVEQCWIDEDY